LLRKPKAANPCKDGAVKRKTRNVMWERGLDAYASGQGPVTGSSEQGKDLSGSLKSGTFLQDLGNH
jgi:hypothetical protein